MKEQTLALAMSKIGGTVAKKAKRSKAMEGYVRI